MVTGRSRNTLIHPGSHGIDAGGRRAEAAEQREESWEAIAEVR